MSVVSEYMKDKKIEQLNIELQWMKNRAETAEYAHSVECKLNDATSDALEKAEEEIRQLKLETDKQIEYTITEQQNAAKRISSLGKYCHSLATERNILAKKLANLGTGKGEGYWLDLAKLIRKKEEV